MTHVHPTQETGVTDHSDVESGRIEHPGEGSREAEAPEQHDSQHDGNQPMPLVGNKKPGIDNYNRHKYGGGGGVTMAAAKPGKIPG